MRIPFESYMEYRVPLYYQIEVVVSVSVLSVGQIVVKTISIRKENLKTMLIICIKNGC